jgi:hypothetical protein
MIVLRYSFAARKTFIRWQKRHPKLVFPIRRLMRREPEVLLVVWQQMLRTEKMILRRARWRLLKKTRKRVKTYVARRWRRPPQGGLGSELLSDRERISSSDRPKEKGADLATAPSCLVRRG